MLLSFHPDLYFVLLISSITQKFWFRPTQTFRIAPHLDPQYGVHEIFLDFDNNIEGDSVFDTESLNDRESFSNISKSERGVALFIRKFISVQFYIVLSEIMN